MKIPTTLHIASWSVSLFYVHGFTPHAPLQCHRHHLAFSNDLMHGRTKLHHKVLYVEPTDENETSKDLSEKDPTSDSISQDEELTPLSLDDLTDDLSEPNTSGSALEGIEDIVAGGEAALKEAEEALASAEISNDSDEGNENTESLEDEIQIDENSLVKEMAADSKQDTLKRISLDRSVIGKDTTVVTNKVEDAIFSTIGGLAVGSLSGAAIDVYLYNIGLDVDVEPIIAPVVLSVALGATGFAFSSQDNAVGRVVRIVLAGFTKGVGGAIKATTSSVIAIFVNNIKAIPGKVEYAAKAKARETAEEISKIPTKVKSAAVSAVEKTADEVSKIPTKVKDAAVDAAEKTAVEISKIPTKVKDAAVDAVGKTVDEISKIPTKVKDVAIDATEKTVNKIKAAPSKVAKVAEEAVDNTVKTIKVQVDEAVSVPAKKIEEVS